MKKRVFCYIYVLIFVLPFLGLAQETSSCSLENEILPTWACYSKIKNDTNIQRVGIGKSYNQAISFAICKSAETFSAEVFEEQSEMNVTNNRQYVKVKYNNTVDIITLRNLFKSEEGANVDYYRCRIGFKVDDQDVFVDERIIESEKDNVTSVTYDSKHVIPAGINLPASLVHNDIDILKTYVTKAHDFYVLIGVDASKIKKR